MLGGAFQPGEVLHGRYVVERPIGAGGMGIVVAARHLELDQPVAVKIMHAQAARNPDSVQRFQREARSAARLRNEHVTKIFDFGRLPSGELFMVMEFLHGEDLAHLLARRGPRPPAEAAHYVYQACEALSEAHALGIVHRDVKPGNLFLTRGSRGEPLVKVLDFGISKIVEEAVTRTRDVMGSPSYMSPEQLQSSRDVDARTDIWSLGVTLYQLVTGLLPFPGDSLPQIGMRVCSDPPAAHGLMMLPEALRAIVLRCLQKDPERRFSTAAELAQALSTFGGWAPFVVQPTADFEPAPDRRPIDPSLPPTLRPTPSSAPGSAPSRLSRPFIALAALGMALAAGGLSAWWWSSTNDSPAPTPTDAPTPISAAPPGTGTVPAPSSPSPSAEGPAPSARAGRAPPDGRSAVPRAIARPGAPSAGGAPSASAVMTSSAVPATTMAGPPDAAPPAPRDPLGHL